MRKNKITFTIEDGEGKSLPVNMKIESDQDFSNKDRSELTPAETISVTIQDFLSNLVKTYGGHEK